DTLTNATGQNLCSQETMKGLKTPLVDLAQRYHTIILLSLHLNRDGQALGRRIKGVTRTLIHLECSDPEHPQRLRLWVEKSYAKKPKPLGVTMRDEGSDYDDDPPRRPDPSTPRRGPVPAKLEECKGWLRERLFAPSRVTDVRADSDAKG